MYNVVKFKLDSIGVEQMEKPIVDNRDWAALTTGQRIRQIEVEGYLVLPGLLAAEHIVQLKAECDEKLNPTPVDYSEHQKTQSDVQFAGGVISELIAHFPTIVFLRELLGNDIVAMSYAYAISEPGHPGISLHTDGQPYGSRIFGYEGSCPFMVRVLYYLDDLSQEVSPFRVVPRSHLCMHSHANPYNRYECHPQEVMVPVAAGSAVLINHRVFHGNFPNTGNHSRRMLAITYRPAWAGPVKLVEPWDQKDIATLSEPVQILLGDRNQRKGDFDGGNKPTNMLSEAPGMNPSRWDRQ